MGRTWKSDYTRPAVEPWWESIPVADVEDIEADSAAAA